MAKLHPVICDVVFIAVGIVIGLFVFNAQLGIDTLVDMRIAILLGASAGYLLSLLVKRLNSKTGFWR